MKLDKTLNADMGRQFAEIEKAVNALPGAISTSGLAVTSPDGSDAGTTQTLANELKTKFNLLVTRRGDAQP